MESSTLAAYRKYRRLVILLLIFPAYKLIDSLLKNETSMAIIMGIAIGVAVAGIIFIEVRIRHLRKE